MNNFEVAKMIINQFSGQANIITVPKIYVEVFEDYNTAILLNQIIFWSDKSKRKDGYFYKTYQEWEEEIFLTKYQVSKSVKKLVDLGLVETKVKKANGSPTVHYKMNMDVFSEWIVKKLNYRKLRNLTNEDKETSLSLTEDYTVNNLQIINNKQQQSENKNSDVKPQAIELYQKIFGFPNMIVLTDIQEMIKTVGDELVCLAIEETARREIKGNGTWKYAEAILTDWQNKGIKTVADAKIEIDNHDRNNKATASNKKRTPDKPIRKGYPIF